MKLTNLIFFLPIIQILEGYGQTENSAVATLTIVGDSEAGRRSPNTLLTMARRQVGAVVVLTDCEDVKALP